MNFSLKLLAFPALLSIALSASAATFEDWSAPQVSVGGTFNGNGVFAITDATKRWAVNHWIASCDAVPEGPNGCYAPANNKLYLHAERSPADENGNSVGHGFLFASLNQISFTNGITLEVPVTPACYQVPNAVEASCGWNVGIYESERNYRSLGIRGAPGGLHLNFWGPCFEVMLDGASHFLNRALNDNGVCPLETNGGPPPYTSVPTPAGGTHVLKIQYWNSSGTWRWDYFLNGAWVAGHPADPDNAYLLGPGHYPGKTARIQLGAFSYSPRPISWPEADAWNGAEGYFGAVTYTTF